jgi:hypothetical protein
MLALRNRRRRIIVRAPYRLARRITLSPTAIQIASAVACAAFRLTVYHFRPAVSIVRR